jgi:hypothetical protein
MAQRDTEHDIGPTPGRDPLMKRPELNKIRTLIYKVRHNEAFRECLTNREDPTVTSFGRGESFLLNAPRRDVAK